jgi:hypothetical protein
MPIGLPRFTVRRAMVSIAVLAIVLAAFRAQTYVGIFAGCVACGTFARSREVIRQRRRAGRVVSRGQIAHVVVASMLITTTIFGVADVVFFLMVLMSSNGRWHSSYPSFGSDSIIVSGLVAVAVGYGMRRWLWPDRPRDERRFEGPSEVRFLDAEDTLKAANSEPSERPDRREPVS